MLNFPKDHRFPRPVPAPPEHITTESRRTYYVICAAELSRITRKNIMCFDADTFERGSQKLPTLQLPPERCGLICYTVIRLFDIQLLEKNLHTGVAFIGHPFSGAFQVASGAR